MARQDFPASPQRLARARTSGARLRGFVTTGLWTATFCPNSDFGVGRASPPIVALMSRGYGVTMHAHSVTTHADIAITTADIVSTTADSVITTADSVRTHPDIARMPADSVITTADILMTPAD